MAFSDPDSQGTFNLLLKFNKRQRAEDHLTFEEESRRALHAPVTASLSLAQHGRAIALSIQASLELQPIQPQPFRKGFQVRLIERALILATLVGKQGVHIRPGLALLT